MNQLMPHTQSRSSERKNPVPAPHPPIESGNSKGRSTNAVSLISDLDSLGELAEAWNRINDEDPAPFQSFPWIDAWYRSFPGQYDEILVFVYKIDGKVAAILPAYLIKLRLFKTNYRVT